MTKYDYSLERRLRELNKDLHTRFSDTVFALQHILSNYKLIFPDFTDHTELHSLNVIEFCNHIIGPHINELNADEIYCLLIGCYFHDTGMGISQHDFEEFSKLIDFGNYFDTHSRDNYPEIIRNFHNEYSGLFIQKYSKFFDFPTPAHLFAIVQISRGHRKTDLRDDRNYPSSLPIPKSTNTICVRYLASLIRLADEIDVTAARNSKLIYDISTVREEIDLIEFMKHDAVTGLEVKEKEFVVKVKTDDEKVLKALELMVKKMQKTLDDCRSVVNELTTYTISQEVVRLEKE